MYIYHKHCIADVSLFKKYTSVSDCSDLSTTAK